MSIEITLPYPPTINHYWRSKVKPVYVGGKRKLIPNIYISEKGLLYRSDVIYLCKVNEIQKMFGRLKVRVLVNPPDNRKRDLDNLTKALFDALAHAGVYNDDNQIDEFTVKRLDIVKGGKVKVIIKEI